MYCPAKSPPLYCTTIIIIGHHAETGIKTRNENGVVTLITRDTKIGLRVPGYSNIWVRRKLENFTNLSLNLIKKFRVHNYYFAEGRL